jgi:hypothetical protein
MLALVANLRAAISNDPDLKIIFRSVRFMN